MPFSSWQFRCTTIHFQATPLRCFSMHIHCGSSRLFSLTSLVNALASPDCTFPSYSIAFRSHSLAHLLSTTHFLRVSILFCSIASPLTTVLVLIGSARFHSNSIQCLSVPTHYFPLQSLTFPMQCISFLFHRLSRPINAVTSPCIALPFLC